MREGNFKSQKLRVIFHPSYWMMALGFVLTGHYLNLVVFTILIVVHEFGHYGMARIFGIMVSSIQIYPYGGKCVLEDFVNRDLHEELLVAMAGVLMQFLFYLLICFFHRYGMVREYTFQLFTIYHRQMILFNLLPIYPLDGGRIVFLILCFVIPYYWANVMISGLSFLGIIGVFLIGMYQSNYSNVMIMGLLLWYLVDFYRKRKFWYQRFLLERYLYGVPYSKVKVIGNLKGMYRNCIHLFRRKKGLIGEREVLLEIFDQERKR